MGALLPLIGGNLEQRGLTEFLTLIIPSEVHTLLPSGRCS